MLFTGMITLRVASGEITRPALSLFFLMYSQTFFVTSVDGNVFAPQIAANASESFFGAKMPFFAFFMANAFFLPFAFFAVLPKARLAAVVLRSSALVIVAFFVVVVATVVFVVVVVVVIAIEG